MTPVSVLTGFLGSGKTTALNRLLAHPDLADTAVVINEFGAVGIDHLLVEHSDATLRVLTNGCLCCTVRGDLVDTLADLAARRTRGEIAFRRVVIETSGLADPVPVLHALMADPALAEHYRLDGVATTVDAVNGAATLQRHAEAVKQVGVADALWLTKPDLAEPAAVLALAAALHRLNPGARLHTVRDGAVEPAQLVGIGTVDPLACADVVAAAPDRPHLFGAIRAHAFRFDEPLPRAAFLHWLELMAAMRGERMLRLKGLVAVADRPGRPLVVHGVQHVLHPPRELPAWPGADRRTRLVFIVDGIARDEIEHTFRKFVRPTETA